MEISAFFVPFFVLFYKICKLFQSLFIDPVRLLSAVVKVNLRIKERVREEKIVFKISENCKVI